MQTEIDPSAPLVSELAPYARAIGRFLESSLREIAAEDDRA